MVSQAFQTKHTNNYVACKMPKLAPSNESVNYSNSYTS